MFIRKNNMPSLPYLIRTGLWLAVTVSSFASADAAPRIAEVSPAMCQTLRAANVLHEHAPVSCAQLRIVYFSYLDFDGRQHDDGAVMVLAAAAEQVQAIFSDLLQRRFAIAGARLIEQYRGDDQAAMRDNNTSAFNDRPLTHGSAPSLHAYGLAIDINPVQNPYLEFDANGHVTFSPAAGSRYANRQPRRPGKPIRAGMAEQVVEVFAAHGFTIWGGDWDAPIDYQHFQVSRALAERLAALPAAQARKVFSAHVAGYRRCLASHPDRLAARIACADSGKP